MDLSAALSAATSDKWEDRASAAQVLAGSGGAEADRTVAALLDDDNLAVISSAAAALLAIASAPAVRRFTAAYAEADDQAGDVMNDQLRVAVATITSLRTTLIALADQGDAGARRALDWLG